MLSNTQTHLSSGRDSSLTWRKCSVFIWMRTMTSDLEEMTLIPAGSQTSQVHTEGHGLDVLPEIHHLQKAEQRLWVSQTQTAFSPWLNFELLFMNTINRIKRQNRQGTSLESKTHWEQTQLCAEYANTAYAFLKKKPDSLWKWPRHPIVPVHPPTECRGEHGRKSSQDP